MMKRILNGLIAVFLIGLCATAMAAEYDGLWFMGFNLNKDVFGNDTGKLVRQAVNYAVDRDFISSRIIGDLNTPTTVLPPGMDGQDGSIKGYPYDLAKAKALMKKAGYSMKDKRLKGLVLLHTDGDKTIKIAKAIKDYLSFIGIGIKLKQMDYEDQQAWDNALSSGKHHLFLMGYKAHDAFDGEQKGSRSASAFLNDLFHSKGSANFFFLRDEELDSLIDGDRPKEASLRLQEDPVTVNLFYITVL